MKTSDVPRIKELIFSKVFNEITSIENRKNAIRHNKEAAQYKNDDFLNDSVALGLGKSFYTKSSPTKSIRAK